MQVPPSCFDYTYQPSGTPNHPVIYGAGTILTDHSLRTYAPSGGRMIVMAGVNEATPGYYQFLDTRFDTAPSGWGA